MIRNIKVLGLAFVAVLAMNSIAASAAQAASALDLEATPGLVTGEQLAGALQDKLTIGANITMKCETSTLHATTTVTKVEEFTATPTYAMCQLGGQLAHLNFNGCQYTFTATATATVMDVDIVCPAGKSIVFEQTATGCIVAVKPQGPLGKITLSNVAGVPPHVNAKREVTGLHYEGNAKCPPSVFGTHSDGQLTGTTTLKGYQDIFSGSEGPQVSLQAT